MQSEHSDPLIDAFYRGRRVCVTGGAGFIGSHLVDALVQRGAIVTVIDDLSNGLESNLSRATAMKGAGRVRLVRGSILDERAMGDAVRGADVVFHQAALASVPRSVEEPQPYFRVNATGTLLALEAARQAGARRFVYAASSSAYGDCADGDRPKVESMCAMPASPYATAKFAGEHMVRTWHHCYGLSGVSLRYFNIFGSRQRPDSPYAAVVPRFAEAYLAGRTPVIYGDGTQTRDFTHVDNAVRANLLAGACERELRGEVVNIACGQSFTLLELVREMARIIDVEPRFELAPPRVGEVKHSRASIEAANQLIGYQPVVEFRDGLERTLHEFCQAATALDK